MKHMFYDFIYIFPVQTLGSIAQRMARNHKFGFNFNFFTLDLNEVTQDSYIQKIDYYVLSWI